MDLGKFGTFLGDAAQIGSAISGAVTPWGQALGAVGALGSLFGIGSDSTSKQKELAKYQAQLDQEMWLERFNLQNEYNDPKNMRSRLENAGMNPNLAYGSLSPNMAANPHSNSPSGQISKFQTAVEKALSLAQLEQISNENKLKQNEASLMKAEEKKVNEEAISVKFQRIVDQAEAIRAQYRHEADIPRMEYEKRYNTERNTIGYAKEDAWADLRRKTKENELLDQRLIDLRRENFEKGVTQSARVEQPYLDNLNIRHEMTWREIHGYNYIRLTDAQINNFNANSKYILNKMFRELNFEPLELEQFSVALSNAVLDGKIKGEDLDKLIYQNKWNDSEFYHFFDKVLFPLWNSAAPLFFLFK